MSGSSISALLLVGESQGSRIAHRHQAQHQAQAQQHSPAPAAQATNPPAPKPDCRNTTTRDDANYCEGRRAAKAAHDQAKWSFWQLVVGVIGIVFVVGTLVYTAIAATAARKAAEAIPLLERAYVYSLIVSDNVMGTVAGALNALAVNAPQPRVALTLKNYGKTPATIVSGEIFFSSVGAGPVGSDVEPWPAAYQTTLAEGEATDAHVWTFPARLGATQAMAIEAGTATLRLWGWATYVDLWGIERHCDIGWTYSATLKRMTPDDPRVVERRRKKLARDIQRSRLLSRLLPHRWLRRRA